MINKKTDISSVKKNNQKLILQTIFASGVISRAEIAKELSMSKPAVNEHIDLLLSEGIIREMGIGNATRNGGRRPILIEPNPIYKINLALDLNYAKPLVALGTVTGNPIDKLLLDTLEEFDSDEKEEESFDEFKILIKESIDSLISNNGISFSDIGVAVISTPGIIIHGEIEEVYLNTQFKSRYPIKLKKFLESNYNFKVIVKNDVNMAAVGEAKFLKSENVDDLLFLSCGLGLGAAMVFDGKLYEGSKNAAGEIGYFIDSSDNVTLDKKISIRTLLKNLKDGIKKGEKSLLSEYQKISFDSVIRAYNDNDEFVVSEIRKIGKSLGIAANNVVAMCDIDTIVVGGDYIAFKDIIIPEIEAILLNSKLPLKPRIIPTALNYAGGIIGCFVVASNYIIENLEI